MTGLINVASMGSLWQIRLRPRSITTSIQFVSSSSSTSSGLKFEKILTFKVIFPNTRVMTPLLTLIVASIVAKNGLPKIIGIWELTFWTSSISKTTKSTGKTNVSIRTNTSSKTPLGYFTNRSASYSVILVGLSYPRPNCWYTVKGSRFTLDLRSRRALFIFFSLIIQEIVGVPGSLSFRGSSLRIMVLT